MEVVQKLVGLGPFFTHFFCFSSADSNGVVRFIVFGTRWGFNLVFCLCTLWIGASWVAVKSCCFIFYNLATKDVNHVYLRVTITEYIGTSGAVLVTFKVFWINCLSKCEQNQGQIHK